MKKNSTSPFVRKIIYIAVIGGLLIPLSMISRPEVADADGQIVDGGGRLAQMRRKHKLAQASISEIDPTSEAMKLASMGLRGVAVNILWMQALEHQKNENYDKLAQTLQTLTKVQPNFVKVWEFQGHNLAFNVSMEFDDYEYRYEWVKKGLEFLKGGIAYNKDDHRMTDNMGFFTGTKFGKSDEKMPFRRIFRKDDQFHSALSDYIAPDSYDAREYGPDSYKMAWHWYDISENMVNNGAFQYKSDLMFWMHKPTMTRQQAMILGEEFRTDEVIREIWETAKEEWEKYGITELRNSLDVGYNLERLDQYERKLADLRSELDKLVPGARKRNELSTYKALELPEEQIGAITLSPENLDDAQRRVRTMFYRVINDPTRPFDRQLAREADAENQNEARRIADEISDVLGQMASISKDGGVINYAFWKARNAAESTDSMVRARQAMYDAAEMRRKSIFEDEFVFDYETGEKSVQRAGAATLYEQAFIKWDEVLNQHDGMTDTPVMDQLVEAMQQYLQIRAYSGKEWPDNFVLQWLIDERAASGDNDNVPTSLQLKSMKEDAEEDEALTGDSVESDDAAAKDNSEAKADESRSDSGELNDDGEQDADNSESSSPDKS